MSAISLASATLPCAIVASGAVTAVGFNAPATFAAIRGGLSGVIQENLWDDAGGELLASARPRTPQWWEGDDMLAELAAAAVFQCFEALPRNVSPSAIPVHLVLHETSHPDHRPSFAQDVASGIEVRLGLPLAAGSRMHAGRCGVGGALLAASKSIAENAATHAVVVGVDSFLRQRVVDHYAGARRVLAHGNSNGFIPGEAACAVLLASESHLPPEGALRVVGWGAGRETGTIIGSQPPTGDGLTRAMRQALQRARVQMSETDYWLTDQNAEHYKAKECTIAQIRLERREAPAAQPYQIWHPIQYVGEIGSAIGPFLLGLAWSAARGSYAPGPLAMMSVGDDDGARAAFVLRWQPGGTA